MSSVIVRGPPVAPVIQFANGIEARLLDNIRLRVEFLELDLIRVSMGNPTTEERKSWIVVDSSGDVPWGGRDKTDLSRFSCPTVSINTTEGNCYRMETSKLRIVVDFNCDLKIQAFHVNKGLFYSDQDFEAYRINDRASLRHTLKRLSANEEYFGFGECAGKLNKSGERLRVDARDAMGYDAEKTDPLYKHWPYHFTRTGEKGFGALYGLLYDTLRTGVFDLGKEISAFRGPYRYFETARGERGLDYYLFTGNNPAELSTKLHHVIGPAALPPRWALGYLASGMSYTESANAQQRLEQFVSELKQNDFLPLCTAFHLSSGYTTTQNEQELRCVFTWNTAKVSRPNDLFQHFATNGMHVIANVKPWLLVKHPKFTQTRRLFFSSSRNPNEPALGRFWASGAGTSELGCYLDFSNQETVQWWKREMTDTLLQYGCDSIWNDNNEYEVEDMTAMCSYADNDVEAVGKALHSQLMAKASLEALKEYYAQAQDEMLVVSRSGSIGTHRYAAQTWSGDNSTSWNTLRFNITMCLGLGLSGWPASGCDVGGFAGSRPDAELFWRWVQCGVFFPRFSIHSSVWKEEGGGNDLNTEPWMHPQVTDKVRCSMQVRMKLIPQLYSLHVEALLFGWPIARPLLFHYMEDVLARQQDFSFMWGTDLLIAPVHVANVTTTWPVYLPATTEKEVWFDVENRLAYQGGGFATLDLLPPPGNENPTWFGGCPVLLRKGGGFVMCGENNEQERTLVCAGNEAEVTWYEQDGWKYHYTTTEQTVVQAERWKKDNQAPKRVATSPSIDVVQVIVFTQQVANGNGALEQHDAVRVRVIFS